jgi:aminopeptidase
MPGLSEKDLVDLVRSVFPGDIGDRALGILVDVPRDLSRDNPDWKARRAMAEDWHVRLKAGAAAVPLETVLLVAYPDVGSNNAELPAEAMIMKVGLPGDAAGLAGRGEVIPFERIFRETQLFLAPTEYSTTAPLKNAARRHLFRAATMPGFSERMIPALRIDYGEVGRRVGLLKARLDRAEAAEVEFLVDGGTRCAMVFDLRYRTAHESSGRFPVKGTAGNLPSGEAYIVPYEGEKGEPSLTAGVLPVQVDDEIVMFTVEGNRAVAARGSGAAGEAEAAHLVREPAYGNMAELGFGVLGDFGLLPVGEILLDEKLGLHVAFGRSDHFGGRVGPADFSSAAEVIHLDRIYIPATQPRILVRSVVLRYPDASLEVLMENGRYKVF